MPLHPPHRGIVERMLLMGGPGGGKTRAWLTIAELARLTKSDAHFWAIDTEMAIQRMIWEGFPKLAEWDQLHVYDAMEWKDYTTAIREIQEKAGPDDFVIVDLFNIGWEEVQNYYSLQVYGESKGDFFLAMRQQLKASAKTFQAFDGWTDWNVIKPLYQDFATRVFFKHKGHTIICTGMKALDRKTDAKDIVQMFAHLGFRPEGEKRTPHSVHTVILMSQVDDSEWVMDTAKDRERGIMVHEPVKNFARNYLVRVAGWKLK